VLVDGSGGEDEVQFFVAEALLPEHHAHLAAGGAVAGPDALAVDEGGRLLPEKDFTEIGEAGAVRDHAVIARQGGGAEAGLRGAGDGGEECLRGAEAGDVFDEVPAECCDLDDEEFGGHGEKSASVKVRGN
jgi:hypothetical protein